MNLRKTFNIFSKAQKAILDADEKIIMDKCALISADENQEQDEFGNAHNKQCPACKEKLSIVDRWANVQGNVILNGQMRLGFGNITGNITVETTAVNHCNKCSNEWPKYHRKFISSIDVLKVAFNYFGQILENPEEKKRPWKLQAIGVFDDCNAESIYRLRKKNHLWLHHYTNSRLSLSCLREYYQSIYDKDKRVLKTL